MLLRSTVAAGLLAALLSFVGSVPALAQDLGDYRSQLRRQFHPPSVPYSDPEVTGSTGRSPAFDRDVPMIEWRTPDLGRRQRGCSVTAYSVGPDDSTVRVHRC